MKQGKRFTAVLLCIVFTAMLAYLCVFSYVHCPCACPGENCRVCLLIHSATVILNSGIITVCTAIAMLMLANGCILFNKSVKRRSHMTLITLRTKLSN